MLIDIQTGDMLILITHTTGKMSFPHASHGNETISETSKYYTSIGSPGQMSEASIEMYGEMQNLGTT